MMQILIADMDLDTTTLLDRYLSEEGFACTIVHDGAHALKKALNQSFDVILMDILLTEKNGFEVLKTLREHTNVPVLMLSARQNELDKLVAFELGANDYVTKPCSLWELTARIRSLVSRHEKKPMMRKIIQHQHMMVDSVKREVYLHQTQLDLTNTEFNILEMLLKSPGQAFSKEELTEYALGRKYTTFDRSIDVHISNLRQKLGKNVAGEHWLKTVRGFGYAFNVEHTETHTD